MLYNWIKRKILAHEYKGVFRELEVLGNRSNSLKETYNNLPESDGGLDIHAKAMVVKEYNEVGEEYTKYARLLIKNELYEELHSLHMKLFNTEYFPNNIEIERL